MKDDNHDDLKKAETSATAGRVWTQRFSGPIVYRRFSGLDAGNRPYIFFKIEQPILDGTTELAQAVYEILHELKYLDRDPTKGKGSGREPTGLTFSRDRVHGKIWKVRDNRIGRTVADIIDAKLTDLAQRFPAERGNER